MVNIAEEKISQEFRLKNIGETKNYFIKEIKRNELINSEHQKLCRVLNYIEHQLILDFTITGYLSISAFAFSLGVRT